MICQATYDSLEDIPETLRGEFESKGGKWQLKDDAIPGVGPLFNPALAANENKAVAQVKARNAKISELETQITALENKLAVVDIPGSVSLSPADAKQWEKYTALGSVKDLQAMKEELETLQSENQKFNLKESLAAITGESGLNHDVLSDWATSKEGEGLEFFAKTIKTDDGKETEVPYVKIETKDDKGKITVTEKELLVHAKESLPAWKFDALMAEVKPGNAPVAAPQGKRLPDLGKASGQPSDKKAEKPVDTFNKERASVPNPFQPTAAAATK